MYVGIYKNLQWVQIDAKELPLCILIFQNFHCVLGSISTFCIYMYLNFQCVLSFRIFQNLQCVFYSVYRCISSVLEFPIMLGYITRTSFIYWDLSELTLCIGLYPDGGRGTSFITALEDSTEWLPLDFLLLEELGRESACLLQNHEVYGTWTFKTFLIYIYSFKNPDSIQPQTVNVSKLININMCNWYFASINSMH